MLNINFICGCFNNNKEHDHKNIQNFKKHKKHKNVFYGKHIDKQSVVSNSFFCLSLYTTYGHFEFLVQSVSHF